MNKLAVIMIVLSSMLWLTPVTYGQEATDVPSSDASDDGIPEDVAASQDEWALANHDYGNTRATMMAAIDSSNVAELTEHWMFPIPGMTQFGSAASAPLIADGIVYFQDLASNVFALDLETGALIWEHRYEQPVAGPNGLGLGYGKLFGATSTNTFAALDVATGEELWSITTENPVGAFQPYAYNGMIFVTTQSESTEDSYAGGRAGHILALDVETGDILWNFQTIADDFWGDPALNGGGGVFYSPAIDIERNLTYWAVGNPVPFPGTVDYPNGSSRPGPNPYTNSMIALDPASGELVWDTQVKPHDLFGLDFQLSPILTTIDVDGEARDVVIGGGKLGRVVAFDRDSGDIVWNVAVGRHENDELEEIPAGETISVYPGGRGGIETPMAFADGTIYAAVNELGTEFTATGFDALTAQEAASNIEEHTPVGTGTSQLVAIDAQTGDVKWAHDFGIEDFAGATVVNDLVFTATLDGVVYALSREDGAEVWRYQAQTSITAWASVSGDTLVIAAGAGEVPVLIALKLPNAEG